MWNLIRKRTNLTPCPSFSVVTGMEANVDMFTSFLGPRDLCLLMILLIIILMQMHTRSVSSTLPPNNFINFLVPVTDVFHFSVQWVSHRNHRGNICGVDFIWLLNPNSYRKLLKTSWSEAVFCMFKVSKTYSLILYSYQLH